VAFQLEGETQLHVSLVELPVALVLLMDEQLILQIPLVAFQTKGATHTHDPLEPLLAVALVMLMAEQLTAHLRVVAFQV